MNIRTRLLRRTGLTATEDTASGKSSPLGVLILADDPIVRAGLSAVLDQKGVLTWADCISHLDTATLSSWDYVLIWLSRNGSPDRYAAIDTLTQIPPAVAAAVPLVAVNPVPVSPMVRLRLAEAGVRYLAPQSWCVEDLESMVDCLRRGDIPISYHLPTPLALRQELSLSLEGALEPLLRAAKELPPKAWTGATALQHLGISRAQVQVLRRLALETAGIPAPHFTTYSSALRSAPTMPSWPSVRSVVRSAFDVHQEVG
ncbi:hypothetical protein LFT45_17130 [Arthrobacter sp. FW305-BF8]|uniref:hypothetical protein n=1 Tax=Arthrobacter sp. FW305-BF8 TaxID=2879617 RepID=UPI001F2FF68E|nr:hypothetical protein [Arthrobacter sp. FW305-BF8]UKA53429.1 hypothetical protein LFT45_17130 [Arthrobacter sp. FW305-BF8]